MHTLKIGHFVLLVGLTTGISSCASLLIEHVNFGWPVESVLTVTTTNTIEDVRYAVSFSVAGIASEEFEDSTALKGTELRLLRNTEGFYFITGPQFKHVYVMKPGPSELVMKSKIAVGSKKLVKPALNQRPPHVELIDDSLRLLLTSDDIAEGKQQ
jgi:hypothetical protein